MTSLAQQLDEYQSQLNDVNVMLQSDPTDTSLIKLRDDLLELIALTKSDLGAADTAPLAGPDGQLEQEQRQQDMSHVPNQDSAPLSGAASLARGADRSSDEEEDDEDNDDDGGEEEGDEEESGESPSNSVAAAAPSLSTEPTSTSSSATATTQQEASKKLKKKSSASNKQQPSITTKTFEVPPHLIPLDSDTETERKRKLRAIKALKSKFRERLKETQTLSKQKSWQDFMNKAKTKKRKGVEQQLKKGRSIFATQDGVDARVGVISGGGKAAVGGRTEFGERKRHKHV